MSKSAKLGVFGLAAVTLTGPALAAPTEKVIYQFLNSQVTGSHPYGAVIRDASGNLYTTAWMGGPGKNRHFGTVFELTPPASGSKSWTEQTLYTFKGGSDGANPQAALVADANGDLYGTASGGGASNDGTVFELTPPAAGQTTWSFSLLYSFHGTGDGSNSISALIFDGQGALYGTAVSGGNTSGDGTVFKLTPPAKGKSSWVESTLYEFQGGADGAGPGGALLIDDTGALYGTTLAGGTGFCTSNNVNVGCGTIFKLAPPASGQSTWTETLLYTFTGSTDGATPPGALVRDKSGALYGNASAGGLNPCTSAPSCGVSFKLAPPGSGQSAWTETVLYTFQGDPDGWSPTGDLTFDRSGNLYGITARGGTGNIGTVFELVAPTSGQSNWSESVLYDFPGNYSNGGSPRGGGTSRRGWHHFWHHVGRREANDGNRLQTDAVTPGG